MERKKVLGFAVALLALAGVTFGVVVTRGAGAAVTNSDSYSVTATVTGSGTGAVNIALAGLLDYSFTVNAPFEQHLVLTVPDVLAHKFRAEDSPKLHAEHLGGKIITGTGDIRGHITVVIGTPAGSLTVYDKDFDFTTPAAAESIE
jgi:hypothetical protein